MELMMFFIYKKWIEEFTEEEKEKYLRYSDQFLAQWKDFQLPKNKIKHEKNIALAIAIGALLGTENVKKSIKLMIIPPELTTTVSLVEYISHYLSDISIAEIIHISSLQINKKDRDNMAEGYLRIFKKIISENVNYIINLNSSDICAQQTVLNITNNAISQATSVIVEQVAILNSLINYEMYLDNIMPSLNSSIIRTQQVSSTIEKLRFSENIGI